MDGLLNWLKGKKTYIIAIGCAIVAGLTAMGIVIPEWVWPVLAALGLGSIRAAVRKGES